MVTFAKRFREIRGPLTQRKLEPIIDVTDKTIREWEKGESEPRLSSLLRIADATGLSLDYICGRTDERPHNPLWWISEVAEAQSAPVEVGSASPQSLDESRDVLAQGQGGEAPQVPERPKRKRRGTGRA